MDLWYWDIVIQSQLALTHPSYYLNFGLNPDHARNSLTNCGVKKPRYGDWKVRHLHTRKKGMYVHHMFALTNGQRSKRQLHLLFTMAIWPSSTCLIPEVPCYLRCSQARVTFLSIDWISKTTGTWLDEGARSTNTQIWSNKKRIQTPRAPPVVIRRSRLVSK